VIDDGNNQAEIISGHADPSGDPNNEEPPTKTIDDQVYVGGGFIDPVALANSIRGIMTEEYDSSHYSPSQGGKSEEYYMTKIKDAVDEAGVTEFGGILTAEEIRGGINDGRTLESMQSRLKPEYRDIDRDSFIYITQEFSLASLYNNIRPYFQINQYEMKTIILDLPQEVIDAIVGHLSGWNGQSQEEVFHTNACGGRFQSWNINTLYWSGQNKGGPDTFDSRPDIPGLVQTGLEGDLNYYLSLNYYFQDELPDDEKAIDITTGLPDPVHQYRYNAPPLGDVLRYFTDGVNIGQGSTNAEIGTSTELEDGLQSMFTLDDEDEDEEDMQDKLDALQKPESNAYYKIMWAGLGVCSTENDGDLEGDECEDNPEDYDYYDEIDYKDYDMDSHIEDDDDRDPTEYGFTYLETWPVSLKGENLPETTLSVTPKSPLYNEKAPGYSDSITVSSNLKDSSFNKDFVYYDWEIYKCSGLNDTTCTDNSNNWLTKDCDKGDSLEECTREIREITNEEGETEFIRVKMFNTESFISGMGVSNITFKPNGFYVDNGQRENSLIGEEEDLFLKIILKTKKENNDSGNEMALSTAMVKVSKKDVTIELYKTKNNNSSYDVDEEICFDGVYSFLCPVYPFQVLAAKASVEEGTIRGYFWELNGRRIYAPRNCKEGSGNTCGQNEKNEALVYFPVTEAFEELQEVKLNIQIYKNGVTKNLTSTRNIAVKNPFVFIKTADPDRVWSNAELDGYDGDYSSTFYTKSFGERVRFRADIVPGYLDFEEEEDELELTWSFAGKKVDDSFKEQHPELDIFTNNDEISFLIPTDFKGINLGATVTKKVSDRDAIETAWGIGIGQEELKETASISIKRDFSTDGALEETASLRMFFASTVKNAPEYLIFSLKLSIVIVLIWSALFGSSFFFETYRRKND
ncbi:MAG: hypothetical protein PF549_00915, partial [Patescibacteria group bacterium]|nr:hypothetical protein [Patescibacteria group bacterium]